jgi:aryl-alcohol dehydrogenase-like predicted oxidoreductase
LIFDYQKKKGNKMMHYRELGQTGMRVSEISFGSWAIGSDWGPVNDKESIKTLRTAVDGGVNFFDTADVYGMGRSERLIAKLKKEYSERIYVATKVGRRASPHIAESYTPDNIEHFIEDSLKNLEVEALDLLQLHCPPTEVYYHPELFEALDNLVKQGKLLNYGVSVEKVEEALKAIEYPGVKTVQIIFNMFRHRPAELLFREAKRRKIGIIARVPLASGLFTGKMNKDMKFSSRDHRNYNRRGQAFDRGETFSGVDFEKGLNAVEELKKVVPSGMSMAQFALRWILMFDAVSCTIPGAKHFNQVEENIKAAEFPPLIDTQMEKVKTIYDQYIRKDVHYRW